MLRASGTRGDDSRHLGWGERRGRRGFFVQTSLTLITENEMPLWRRPCGGAVGEEQGEQVRNALARGSRPIVARDTGQSVIHALSRSGACQRGRCFVSFVGHQLPTQQFWRSVFLATGLLEKAS